MITKESITSALAERFDFKANDIKSGDNLFKGQIDSLDFLEFARLIGVLAEKESRPFDVKDFLYSECYTVDDIYNYLKKSP